MTTDRVTSRTWLRCGICHARLLLTTGRGYAAAWCSRCDRLPEYAEAVTWEIVTREHS
jgi:phage FluMu protein Com